MGARRHRQHQFIRIDRTCLRQRRHGVRGRSTKHPRRLPACRLDDGRLLDRRITSGIALDPVRAFLCCRRAGRRHAVRANFRLCGELVSKAAGVAIGVAAAGQAAGQGAIPLLAAWLIEPLGWRNAMLALGCGTLAILVPLAWGLRRAPAAAAAGWSGEPELQPALAVQILSAAVFFCCTCMAVPLMHLMPLIQSLCISSTDAGSVMFVMLLAAIAGRIAYGKLCDKIGATRSWFVASALQTVGVLAFTQFGSLREFFLFGRLWLCLRRRHDLDPGRGPRPDAGAQQGDLDGTRAVVRLARPRIRRVSGRLGL